MPVREAPEERQNVGPCVSAGTKTPNHDRWSHSAATGRAPLSPFQGSHWRAPGNPGFRWRPLCPIFAASSTRGHGLPPRRG
jgi:hypothetical protein